MKKIFYILIACIGIALPGKILAQDMADTIGYICEIKVIDQDTLIVSNIDEIYVFPPHRFKNAREARRYRRLIRNVKKAYPYAVTASGILEEVNTHLLTLETEKERREYVNEMEDKLREEFEEDLKNLTITQGRILIKLIDRETGDTSYELVKELKGSLSAFFWQTFAALFGSSLKTEYDPDGEDALIEEIVILIENGQL